MKKRKSLAFAIVEGFNKETEEIKEGSLVSEAAMSDDEDTNESTDYLKEMGDMDDETRTKLEEEMKDMTDEEKMDHIKKVKEGSLEDEKSMKA